MNYYLLVNHKTSGLILWSEWKYLDQAKADRDLMLKDSHILSAFITEQVCD